MTHPVHPDLLVAGVRAIELADGVPGLRFTHELFSATLSLQGGQLLDFTPVGGKPLLYLSPAANLVPGKAIRGGVPLCWPWFGKHPTDASRPQHGVARTAMWSVSAIARHEFGITVKLAGPHDGTLESTLTLEFGRSLAITLSTHNAGKEPQRISQALHSYLAVSSLPDTQLHGLGGLPYQDKLDGGDKIWPAGDWQASGPCDTVVSGAPALNLQDPGWQRRIEIGSEGSASTVVWTPWQAGAAALADLPDDGWQHFLCVETANAGADSREIAPGASHHLLQRLTVVPL